MQPTYLYLTEADGVTKIGITNDPARRLRELQTSNATPLDNRYTIPLTYDVARKLEAYLHKKYDGVRTRGEWFEISADEIYAEISLSASILRSVATSPIPTITRERTVEVVKGRLPELTKGNEIIYLDRMAIPHYWISYTEMRAKPCIAGDEIVMLPWQYRITYDLVKTADLDILVMIRKATEDRLYREHGNAKLISERPYAPYTLMQHASAVGYYDSFGGFVKAA